MTKKHWFIVWGCLFILCALLGFIPEPGGFLKVLLVLAAALFFVPPWVLLYFSFRQADTGIARIIRGISLTSLGTTLFFLVLNLLSGHASPEAGNLLHGFLVIFSSPMVCSQYWVVSLFLWACLLMTSFSILHKSKKR